MGLGLVSLVLVLGVVGSLLAPTGLGGETIAWIVLLVGVAWLALSIWWSRRAPAQHSDEVTVRYWAALRHARFGPRYRSEDEQAQQRHTRSQ